MNRILASDPTVSESQTRKQQQVAAEDWLPDGRGRDQFGAEQGRDGHRQSGRRPGAVGDGVLPFRTPGGRPIPRGPNVATFQEIQAVVAANQAVCVVFAEANRYYQRPGIAYLPIRDAPLRRWALIWRNGRENPLRDAFARAARDASAGVAG